eukprot:Unigene7486_Nuclearia_a/m.23011 Unigene7486_Nuclearia_a/g.23011  ORF Unigene7486_Nuclearia_a/g.23011 Unigene7486_Nuclearia_a/m.23011 type:complete len:385 (-) Unigene7486_Nuclearia_a:535-1689(-)
MHAEVQYALSVATEALRRTDDFEVQSLLDQSMSRLELAFQAVKGAYDALMEDGATMVPWDQAMAKLGEFVGEYGDALAELEKRLKLVHWDDGENPFAEELASLMAAEKSAALNRGDLGVFVPPFLRPSPSSARDIDFKDEAARRRLARTYLTLSDRESAQQEARAARAERLREVRERERERIKQIQANPPQWGTRGTFSLIARGKIGKREYRRMVATLNKIILEPLWREYYEDQIEAYMKESSRNPQIRKARTVDEHGRAYGTGKRKSAIARVWVAPGSGNVTINGQLLSDYFVRLRDRGAVVEPLGETSLAGKLNVWATVKGGGTTGQAEAVRYGIAQALVVFDKRLKRRLKVAGLLRRDIRRVERKKPGQKKARKKFTWVKR